MKQIGNKIWLLACIILLSQSAFSQRKTRLSFTGSPSINWLSSDIQGVESTKAAIGFDYGINADFFFDEDHRYAFATGLLINNVRGNLRYYDDAGSIRFAGETFASGTQFRYRLKYVEVPLTVKLQTSQFRRWAYWGQFGFSSFVNIMAKGDSDNGVLDKHNIHDEVSLFNVALNIGIGSNFDLGSNNAVTVGLIYKNGFIDVTSNEQFDDKTTLNSVVLKLGLIF
jgi:hypothetical protein